MHAHLVPRLQQEQQSELPGRVLGQGLADSDEILQRLGHLQALNVEVTRVEEVVHPLKGRHEKRVALIIKHNREASGARFASVDGKQKMFRSTCPRLIGSQLT